MGAEEGCQKLIKITRGVICPCTNAVREDSRTRFEDDYYRRIGSNTCGVGDYDKVTLEDGYRRAIGYKTCALGDHDRITLGAGYSRLIRGCRLLPSLHRSQKQKD